MKITSCSLIVGSLLLTALACGSTSPNGAAPVTEIYDVITANDQTLPLALPNRGSCTETGLNATVTLLAVGRFTASYKVREQCGTISNDRNGAFGGSFSRDGMDLVFHPDSGFKPRYAPTTPISGSVSGSTLTAVSTPRGVRLTITANRR